MNTRIRRHYLDYLIDNSFGRQPGLIWEIDPDEAEALADQGLVTLTVAGDAWLTRKAWDLVVHHTNAGTRMKSKPYIIDEPLDPGAIPEYAA